MTKWNKNNTQKTKHSEQVHIDNGWFCKTKHRKKRKKRRKKNFRSVDSMKVICINKTKFLLTAKSGLATHQTPSYKEATQKTLSLSLVLLVNVSLALSLHADSFLFYLGNAFHRRRQQYFFISIFISNANRNYKQKKKPIIQNEMKWIDEQQISGINENIKCNDSTALQLVVCMYQWSQDQVHGEISMYIVCIAYKIDSSIVDGKAHTNQFIWFDDSENIMHIVYAIISCIAQCSESTFQPNGADANDDGTSCTHLMNLKRTTRKIHRLRHNLL